MLNLNRSNFQTHPFHLVSPSPWPLYTSIHQNAIASISDIGHHTLEVQRGLNLGMYPYFFSYFFPYFFPYLKGIVRDISLFVHSNWSSDISVEKLGIKGNILTSSFLDYFPVFEQFIHASKNYAAITHNIDICLWGDLKDVDSEVRIIINRLREISDPYVVQTFLNMQANIDSFTATRDWLPYVNGLDSYNSKYFDYYICVVRVEFLHYLVDYMSQQEVQTFNVAKDTIINIKLDFQHLYMEKVKASEILSKLNYSKLMMEVKWLLLNKPFNP